MSTTSILDANALLTFFRQEEGYEVIKKALTKAFLDKNDLVMNKVNLLEVFYDIERTEGLLQADKCYHTVLELPIKIINGLSEIAFREASRLKTSYKMSLADSILLGTAISLNTAVITAGHHEFDIVEQNENIKFTWFR